MDNLTVSIMGWYGNRNAGDEAVLAGILEHVRGISPNVNINVFSKRPEETAKLHNVNGLVDLPSTIWESLFTPYLWGYRKAYLPGIDALKKSDLCIIGGGGIIADHNPQLIDTWCDRIKLALANSKKVCLYGIGVEPLAHKRSVKMVAALFNSIDLITVRDEESKQILVDAGIKNVVLAADPAFTLKKGLVEDIQEEDLGFKDKVVLCPVHRFKGEDEKEYGLMHRKFATLLANKYPDTKISIGLMFPPDAFLAEYLKDLPNYDGHVDLFEYHPDKIIDMFSQAKALISTRLHGGILGAVANVPVCPIVYDVKVMSFAQLLKIDDLVVEFGDGITWVKKQGTGEQLFISYEKAIVRKDDFSTSLNVLIDRSKEQITELAKILR